MKTKSVRKRPKTSPTRRLKKWQRNNIFEAIKAVGLDPREFDLDDSEAEVRIKHRWSESCFIVGGPPGHYVGSHVVGDEPAWTYQAYSWQALMPRVSRWLEGVKRDLETPDLWAELQREAKLLGAGSDEVAKNTPFTLDEQKEIARRLREKAKYISQTYSLSDAQVQALDVKLDYLVKASDRLGRIDWRNAFIGAIVGYIFAAALPPESARDIFQTLIRAIGSLYPELLSG